MWGRVRQGWSALGFTLVELAIVVVIIGVLAAFGVPRFLRSTERSKASEAFTFLASVRAAQDEYRRRTGTYAESVSQLDLSLPPLRNFSMGNGSIHAGATGSIEDSWRLTLTRGKSTTGYGPYRVTYTQDGFDDDWSSIPDEISPVEAGP
jgi:prepilin-type N-terminal cleavage/methylation domain-containing protein